MALVWGLLIGGGLLVWSIIFFILGFEAGDSATRYGMNDERMRALEAERQMHDLTRQAFIAMAEAAEEHTRTPQLRRQPPRELP